MRVAGYVRVSTSEQVNGYSIPEQTDRIKAYCTAKDWDLLQVYTDAGYSGAKIERPAIKQLLAECSQYDAVVVYKLDRLSRSQKDTLYLLDAFKSAGCAFVSMCESFDTSTAFGTASVGILSVFAQLEREQIKERMQMGMVGRVKKGLYNPGGRLPTGYDYKGNELVINEDEAKQVQLIFDLFIQGKSMRQITQYMHERYTNRYGSYNSVNSVSRILGNPVYTGVMVWNGETYKGTHPVIISPERFALAQQIKAKRAGRNVGKRRHLLTGLLYCQLCGAPLVHYMTTKATGNKQYYVCSNRIRRYTTMDKLDAPRCMLPYMRAEELEGYVLDDLKTINLPGVRRPSKSKSTRSVAEIDKQIAKAMELFTLEQIDRQQLEKLIDKLNRKKTVLLEEQTDTGPIVLAAETARNLMNKITDEQKIEVLNLLVSRIEVGADEMHIFYTF